MNEISIVEAWTRWLSGELSPHVTIWGVSIFWWGRLGKIMQFVGAITIVADIIGPEKIRRFGALLQGTVTSVILIQFLKDCFSWYTVMFRQTLMKDYIDEPLIVKKSFRPSKLDILNYFVSFLLTIAIIFSIKLQYTGWIFLMAAVIIFSCLLVSIAPIITVLTIITLIGIGLILNSVFIKPLAWTLEHPSLDRFTKIISLLFLLIGFHFELLSS